MPLRASVDRARSRLATRFAPAERLAGEALAADLARAASSPIVDVLLQSAGTAVFVVNAFRQILAVNTSALRMLGIDEPEGILGLRPGEAAHCVHAGEEPGGCGTSQACACCGAVLAMLVALRRGHPEERRCALTMRTGGGSQDVELRARAVPFSVDGQDLLMLSLTDVGQETRNAAMGRAFLHDIANVLSSLTAAADAIGSPDPREASEAASDVRLIADRLVREVRLQRALSSTTLEDYRPTLDPVSVPMLLEDLARLFRRHPVAAGRSLEVIPSGLGVIRTDQFLLARILTNMVQNAFEAIPRGRRVRISARREDGAIRFEVHNPGVVPAAVAPRIFQRHFTTKLGPGHGEGTWSMKSLGEGLLQGKVGFDSDRETGTTFWIRLPATVD